MPVKRKRRIHNRARKPAPTPIPKPPNPIRECCQCGVKSSDTDLIISPFKAPGRRLDWWCDKCIYEVEPRLSTYRHKAPPSRPVRRRPRVR